MYFYHTNEKQQEYCWRNHVCIYYLFHILMNLRIILYTDTKSMSLN